MENPPGRGRICPLRGRPLLLCGAVCAHRVPGGADLAATLPAVAGPAPGAGGHGDQAPGDGAESPPAGHDLAGPGGGQPPAALPPGAHGGVHLPGGERGQRACAAAGGDLRGHAAADPARAAGPRGLGGAGVPPEPDGPDHSVCGRAAQRMPGLCHQPRGCPRLYGGPDSAGRMGVSARRPGGVGQPAASGEPPRRRPGDRAFHHPAGQPV